MILEGERKKGVEVRNGVKEQAQKVMNKIIVKAKTGKNMQNRGAETVTRLKENIVPIVGQENEAEAETGGGEPDLEVGKEIAVEVKSIQETGIQEEEEDQEVEREEAHQKNIEEETIEGEGNQGALREKKVKADTEKGIQIEKVEVHIERMMLKTKERNVQEVMKVVALRPVKKKRVVKIRIVKIRIEAQTQRKGKVARTEK